MLSVENGSLWVPYLLKAMDKMKGMGRNGPWLGGYVEGRPSEIFKQHVYVSPYHEEDIVALAELIGDDRILFGSDFPHPEGLAEPAEFADLVATLGEPGRHQDHGRQPPSASRRDLIAHSQTAATRPSGVGANRATPSPSRPTLRRRRRGSSALPSRR